MNPEFERLHRLLSDAKSALHLEKSRKRIVHKITNETYSLNIDVDRIVKHEISKKLSDGIISDYYNHIKKEHLPEGNSYELDIMVMPTESFKMILEYCIQNSSIEDILRIREYGKTDKNLDL